MTRILVVDDHAVVRKGLVQILTDCPEPVQVEEAGSGEEALGKAAHSRFDLVLLDISMPGTGGLDVLRELKEKSPQLPVLVLSMHPEEQYAVRALRGGASGYLTKHTASEELVSAVQKVLKGGKYVSESLAQHLAFGIGGSMVERGLHKSLSERESQVLSLIGAGKTPMEIAEELSLSVKTISTFRIRILRKMNMKGNADLIRYCIEHGLAG